jgi:membrane protein implicated in regulation of membrane protease activity
MPKMLALGLGTFCVIAGVVLILTDRMVAGFVAIAIGTVFDLLFVKALREERKGSARE